MLRKRGVSWVLALALALVGLVVVEPTTAAAATITVPAAQNVRARMARHTGYTNSFAAGGTANYQAADCLRIGRATTGTTTGTAANPDGQSITSATTGYTAYYSSGTTVWVGHGRATNGGNCPGSLNLTNQSSLGFAPTSVSTITPGTIFNLGQVIHKNTGVYNLANDYFRGDVDLQFMGMTLSYTYEMHETPGANVADSTTFINQVSDQTFSHDGLTYTLVIRGFTSPQSGGTCNATVGSLSSVTTTFVTPENATTSGCLYAQVQQVRTLKIEKQVLAPYGPPPSYPAFGFTASSDVAGSPWGSNFNLTPTGTGSAGQAVRLATLVTGQTINIAETAPTGNWSFTGLSCVDGTGSSNIQGLTVNGAGIALAGDYATSSAAAAAITCTYTNTYTPRATLTLVKQVTSTGQPAPVAVPADWTLSATGTGLVAGQDISGPSGNSAVTNRSVIAGSYNLGEVANGTARTAGYVQDGAWSCTAGTLSGNTLTLAAGQNATCTVRNKFAVGRLAITKTVTGDGYTGGTARPFTAAYTCTSGTATVKSGTVTVHPGATNGTPGAAVTIDHVPAGATCAVTESDPPTGTATGLVNSSWVWGAPVNPAAVTIAADATATVNITNPNSQRFGSFQVSKAITPRSDVPGAGYSGGATRTFPVTYECRLGSTTVSSGTLDVSTGTSRTISGIPASSICAVTGEDQTPQSGDFLDASYGWDGYTVSDPVTITPNGTATVTVTNHFRRDLATLNLAKTVTGSGYSGSGRDFRIDYDCGAPYSGTVEVAAGGTEGVTVPAGVACTVAERQPSTDLLRSGYVWDDPTYAGLSDGTVVVPAGGSRTVTVTNPTSIGYGRVQVTKAIDSFASRVTSGTAFEVRVNCEAPARGESADYDQTFDLLWPSATTAITPYLPIGTSCTVTETDAPSGHDALPNASYAWKATPDPVTVQVPASEEPRSVTVTNDIKRVYATFRIAKDIDNNTGHGAGGQHFSGSYRCDYNDGEDVTAGSWSITGQGTAASVDVLVGSVCTVDENTPSAPVPGDRSYTWSTQTPAPTTVGADGATATVVNTLNRAEGSFNITKSVSGGTAGEAFGSGADFGFSYSCTPLSGDEISGTLSLNAGESKAPSEAIPGGSVCTVTEGDFPGSIDPYRWDGVDLSVSGAASSSSQDGRSITFTTTDDADPVSVTAVNSISAKTASVRVSKTITGETGGYTGGGSAIFPVTLTCTGAGAQGTKLVAAGGSATWDDIPLGATCAASEGSTTGGLRDGSYAWAEPTIGDPVKLTGAGNTYQIGITNPIERVHAGIEIAKIVDDGGFAGVLDPAETFSGEWSCRYRDDAPVSGTWSATASADGTLATLTGDADHILVGSKCSLTEATPGSPSSDPSYRWDATPEVDDVTVAAGEPNRVTVTNKLLRDTGKVLVTKELTGETGGYRPVDGFAGFSVTARCYLNDPAEDGRLEATVPVRPGDTVTLIDGVPYGWTCQVNEGAFPTPNQLRDASYAWDSQSVSFPGGGDTTRVTAGNDSPTATVTNGIRRVTGGLAITKAFGDGTAAGVRPGASFSGDYRCTYRDDVYSGTWTVTGSGPASLTGDTEIPFTAECAVTEDDPSDALLLDSSYTWAEPDLGGTVTIESAAEPAELTVTNTATRIWSGLEITKTYDGLAAALPSGLTVGGSWACTYLGDVVASGGWTLPADGGSLIVARPGDVAIPAESSCTVTEHSLADDQLTDASYAWEPVSYSPSGGTVTTEAGQTAQVTVTNATSRVLASFTVAKQVHRGTGVAPSALEANLTFSGEYRCTHPGDDPVTGTWGPVAADAEWTSPPVLVGSTCTVTAEDEPSAPSNADDSYVWGTADLGDPVTVAPAGEPPAEITVTNPVNRITGSFGVTKEVDGDLDGTSPSASYGFEWQCTAANGNSFPADGPGTFGLTAGETFNAPYHIPVGSTCRVAETNLPAPDDASYTWSTELTVTNAEGSADGRTIIFELPRSGGPVAVTAANTLTRTKGSFTVTKSSDPGDGATVVPGQAIHYTVTVATAEVGFTRDVVVTDDLAGVLRHADVTDIQTTQGSAVLDGDDLVWTVGTVGAGAELELTYTATVHADAVGVTLRNTVAATGETPPDACTDACRTEHHTPAWTLSKTSDPASGTVVEPGDVITYTLIARNTSNAEIIGATAVDDLSGLAAAAVGFSSSQLTLTGDRLTWAIPTLAKGEHASVSYTATVRAGADGVTLANQVTPDGAGGTCIGGCATTQYTPEWTLAKTSDPASGSIVAPGQEIEYTLTVTNPGPVAVAPVVHDDISDLVDDATLGTLPDGLTRAGDQLTWAVPLLQPGESAAVSYTATVDADALGVTLANTASPASVGGRCEGSCSTSAHTDAWTLAKTSTAADGATVLPGDVIGYTLTVTNTGPVTLTGARVTDDLSDVLDDAVLAGVPEGATLAGTTLTWQVPDVAPGASATLVYEVTVKDTAVGATLRNAARPAGSGASCSAGCTTTQYTPAWTLAKTSDPATGTTVAPGDTITYTLTATNTGPGVVSGATAIDDLAGVLANADVAFTSSELSQDDTTLTWAIPTLQPGEQAEVTYTATLRAGATGVTVTNSVVPDGAGGSCVDGCATTQATAKWSLTKTSNPATGGIVTPGQVISYTLTVVNEGPVPVVGAEVSDDVSDLVDDAVLDDLPAGLSRSGDVLTWAVPDLAVAGIASITYTATVDADARGVALTNVATPQGAGGYCPISCATTSYTDAWTLTKTSTPGDGATVAPGDEINYTLTVTNTGRTTLSGAQVRDDLSDVLDDATLGELSAAASVTGEVLTWTVPDVAPGDTATLSYTATVNDGAVGARLRNLAAPASEGGTCDGCSTTQYTGAWTLTKSSDPASGVVEPGDVITYTLTAANTSEATVTGATAVDDLSGLAAAEVAFTSTELSRTGDRLTWSIPSLAPGETATVEYTATVADTADGVTLTNTATPQGTGGTCGATCATTHTTPAWTLAKTAEPGPNAVVAPGDEISYTLIVTNTGPAPLTGAQVSDDVSGLVGSATLGELPDGLTRNGETLTWSVPELAVGATASLTYTATVSSAARGATLVNAATPASAGGECTGSCRTTTHTPAWTLAKASDPASGTTVRPGDVIGYALTVTNTGPATLTGARVTDDLADVLDDAALVAVPAGATLSGSTLSWTAPDLAPGASAELTYQVQVAEDADGSTLVNTATQASIGGRCGEACTTTHATPAWMLAKSSDRLDGAVLEPGDVITYTLTATNTGTVEVSGATATDDLTGVLAGAAVTFDSVQLSQDGTTLTWTVPTLAPGQTRTVEYTATIRDGAAGATIANTATPHGEGGSCGAGCSTTQYTAAWTLTKSSDAGPGAVLTPGDAVQYTLTVTNTGPVPVAGARVSDDVSDLVDDATLADLPSGLTRDGDTLTWVVPEVPVGESRSITYAAVIAADAVGATLTNTATPASVGGSCGETCSTTQYTDSWSLAKTSSVGLGATVRPGDTVEYTLTVTNTGAATLTGALVTDDLSDVLDDATLVAVPSGASLEGGSLTWLVPDVAPGAAASLTYRVRVDADALGVTLRNTAAPASAGGSCASDACSTAAHTPAWTLAKTSDPASGAVVKPGDVITYTLTATNTSAAEIRGALALDDLSGVLPHAEVAFTSDQLSLDGDRLTWAIPVLPAGATATVTYTATVRTGADGVTVANSVSPVGAGGSCVGGCATTQSTAAWTLLKTADPASGVVRPGDVVRYTLTVINTGPVPVAGAVVSDDLAEVLDDVLVGDLGENLTRTGATLVWDVPEVPVGDRASVSYTATVAAGAIGVTLTNTAAPVTAGGACLTSCTTTHTTSAWTLAKASDPGDGATVLPGDVIDYTLTVTNTGPDTLSGALVTDNLSDVLDDATLVAVPDGASLEGSTLTWSVPDVPAGETASLNYSATVNPEAVGASLRNAAAPASVGGGCAADGCRTTQHTPAWKLAKSTDVPEGAVVEPGDVITYTLTATNTSDAVVSGAQAIDDLSDVLDDATVVATASGLSLDGGTLIWTIPTLAAGETASVSYTAVVQADGATLANTVTPAGVGASCAADACRTTQYTPAWTLAKTTEAPEVVEPGGLISYTMTVTNTGPVPLVGAVVTDDLSGLVDDAALDDLHSGLVRDGDVLTWSVPTVAVGGTASITYTATVDSDARGATLTNTAAPSSAGGSCLPSACATTQYTPAWTLAKTSTVSDGGTVVPGDVVDYTLTVTNAGPATLSGALVTDDLSDVLDDATLGDLPSAASVEGNTLTWAVPDVAPGESVSLNYAVTVNPGALGVTLRNSAAPASVGGECVADGCTTVAHTPAWTLAKTSDVSDGTVVEPGDVITYTLTAINTSDAVVSGARAIDDLSDVLDDATVDAFASGLSLDGGTLTWAIPTLAAGESATVSYTATVTADGARITNTVLAEGVGATCTTCSTEHFTAGWTLAKTSDPASGAQVFPGDVITYTLSVTNTGPVPLTGAVVTDDLSGIVDGAVLGDLAEDLSVREDELTWRVPTVPVGETVHVSYPATVAAGALGVSLTNKASASTPGGECTNCTTTHATPAWTLAKTSDPGDGATVVPGDVVGYMLAVTNTGPDTLSGALVTDNLGDVLDDATLVAVPDGASLEGSMLTWSVPDVLAGESVSLNYAVTVNSGALGVTLRNSAAPASVGGECVADGCTTVAHTPSWTLAKTSDQPDGAVLEPGAVITYTLTATNTSAALVSGARAIDDLSDVLDDATVDASASGLSLDGGTLTWAIPTLAAGETASVSYTAMVTADGATITNMVTAEGVGASCATCSTEHFTLAWTLAKVSDRIEGAQVFPGDVITYTLTVTNTGPVPLVGARVSDDVSDLIDDATLADLPAGLSRTDDALTWSVPEVPVGGTATVSYSATVTALGATLANTAVPASAGGTCLLGACATTQHTPAWTLTKTSDPGDEATVVPGDVVDYTLTVTNTGPATLSGASVTDDLSDVLDDATLGPLPGEASVEGAMLTWTVPDVAPGESVTLDYSATVNPGALGVTLRNTAAPASVGGECAADGCVTVAHTPSWTLAKTSDVADGAVLEPGVVITYTLTATNTSDAVVSGARAVDDLSDVLDDATVDASPSGLSLDGSTLTWSIPTLAAGESASVTYTATVTADGATITNTVTAEGVGASCTECSTTAFTPAWTLAKVSDRIEGAQVFPGDLITYTLTVTNTGPVPLVGAQVGDDISDLIDDATLGDLPAGLVRDGEELTWNVPEVPVGGTASISYTATVTALGAKLVNTAAPASAGGSCVADACVTTAYSPLWSLAKTSDQAGGATVRPGDVVSYTLTVTNLGQAALAGAQVVDDLGDVLDDGALIAVPEGATLTGASLTWAVPEVPVSGTATLSYQVRLDDAAIGATLRNVAMPATTGGECVEACETVAYTTAWTLTKTSDPGSGATVEPGDQVTYTLTVANTGPVELTSAVVVDDMSGVLDDADLIGELPEHTSLDGTTLTWAVPSVPVGEAVAISYTVMVKAGAYGVTLGNVATGEGVAACAVGNGQLAPIDPDATGACRTRHYSPAWTLEKTSDPASGSVVEPGSEITFTLRVRNTSQAVVANAVVTDDLADLLQYVTIGMLPGGTVLSGMVLTWTVPTLQPGEEAVITYTVRVDDDAYNAAFVNSATPGPGGTCPVTCSTEHTTLEAVVDPVEDTDGDLSGGNGSSSRGRVSGGSLAHTGGDLAALSAGLVLVAVGAGILLASRRRRPEEKADARV